MSMEEALKRIAECKIGRSKTLDLSWLGTER